MSDTPAKQVDPTAQSDARPMSEAAFERLARTNDRLMMRERIERFRKQEEAYRAPPGFYVTDVARLLDELEEAERELDTVWAATFGWFWAACVLAARSDRTMPSPPHLKVLK